VDKRPHIVLVTCDELRADALSCFGNRVIKTPNLDALAAGGTRFQRAYTNSPWCLPSRCSLATGLYPHRNGSYSNFRDIPLDPDMPNIYSLLRGAGYHSAHIGKCHYKPVPYEQTRPDATLPYDEFRDYYLSLGIDHLALQDDKQVSVWFMDDYARELDAAGYLAAYRDATWDRSRAKVFAFPGPAEWHPDSWVGMKAADYVAEYRGDQPLFLWASFSGPHYPFDAPAEYYDSVDISVDARFHDASEFDDPSRIHAAAFHGRPTGAIDGLGAAPGGATKHFSEAYWRELRRNYFANVAQIDAYIGRILTEVERRFGQDVLVIFTADHGEMLGSQGLYSKHWPYRESSGVPFVIRWPGRIEPGSKAADTICLTDFFSTVSEIVGEDLPDETAEDSFSFLKQIKGGQKKTPRAPVIHHSSRGMFAVREGKWKLVLGNGSGGREKPVGTPFGRPYQLFDLSADIGERTNVIAQHAEVAERLEKAFADLRSKGRSR